MYPSLWSLTCHFNCSSIGNTQKSFTELQYNFYYFKLTGFQPVLLFKPEQVTISSALRLSLWLLSRQFSYFQRNAACFQMVTSAQQMCEPPTILLCCVISNNPQEVVLQECSSNLERRYLMVLAFFPYRLLRARKNLLLSCIQVTLSCIYSTLIIIYF